MAAGSNVSATIRDLSRFDNRSFDRGASRAKEIVWYFVRSLVFKTSLPMPSWIRCGCLRAFGAKVGKGVVIRGGVNISFPWRLTIGDHVWIGEDVMILSLASVVIESSACVSQRAFLCTGSHDYTDPTFRLLVKPIHLEAGCWVASMSFIGPGVVIGRGTVCAAGSIVSRSMPACSLVAGNPAAVIRPLEVKELDSVS